MERQERIPKAVFRKLGLIGSLASYRVAAKIVSTFGWTIDKMTIWKAVQGGQRSLTKRRPKSWSLPSIRTRPPTARRMARASAFKASPNGARNCRCSCNTNTAAASASPGWAGDRGVPRRLAYPLSPSLAALKTFKQFLLVTDGDTRACWKDSRGRSKSSCNGAYGIFPIN